MKTDSELVALTRGGNKEAFGQLIDRHQARAMRVALGMVPNQSLAEELVQEAMLQAYLSLDHLREEASFASWLHGIVLNVCRNHLRNRQPDCFSWDSPRWESSGLAPMAPDPARIAEKQERERLLLDAVQSLSPPNRDATLLFYYDQLSLREVAAALGISMGAVKSRLHQSRNQLRERLLAFYPEETVVVPVRRRRRKMVRTTVVPLRLWEGNPLDQEDPGTSDLHAQHFLLRMIMSQFPGHLREWAVLREEGGSRFLPIQLGWDAVAVVTNPAAKDGPPEPALAPRLLQATGSRLEGVRVEPLSNTILHGVIRLRHAGKSYEHAARLGEAMALAVQTDTPISVAGEIMVDESWDLSDALAVVQRLRQPGDEAALRRAADEPLVVRVVQGFVEYALRLLFSKDEGTVVELVLEPRSSHGHTFVWLLYQKGDSTGGGNIALPVAALPMLIARFKAMADLDLTEQHAPQQGHASVHHLGKEYDLRVATAPASFPPEGDPRDPFAWGEPAPGAERLTLRLERKMATTPTDAIPEPSMDRIDYADPQEYLLLNESLGDEARIREIAATLISGTPEQTLVAIGRWIQANHEYDSSVDSSWRNFDTALATKLLGSCADHAIVFAALARACGIPTVFVKSMDVDWIWEFCTLGTRRGWRGHVFLEVFFGGRWRLLDAQTLELHDDYVPGMRLFPGNRYAYDKGADPRELVLSLEGERWVKQTTDYFSRFDVTQLPVGEGQALDALFICGNSPVYQAVRQRLEELGERHTTVFSFNAEFDTYLPRAKGCDLIITCVGDTLVLPEAYHARFLPIPVSELNVRMKTEPGGAVLKRLDDGTRVALIYGRDLASIREAINRFRLRPDRVPGAQRNAGG